MNPFSDDLRTALRQFAQAPLLTMTAVISLAAALGAGALEGYLFGVHGKDTLAFAAALVLIALICAAALTRPALRAARVLPSEALRDE